MWATIVSVVAMLLAGGALYYQARQGALLRKQIQLQGLLDLDKEWNSADMRARRASGWTPANDINLENIEDVLDFLEKVSSFEERNVLDAELVWDSTLGWYLLRYF
jgi:hypothetical protein